ncbi:DUF2490 domain-containing protein [Marinilongibacter aquaticus]|uniref:DUF2490 domain-containing protein n=1 Tax=Marinilongibacter aquaticus TaxID=2975157 RepID=UPI0021BDBD5D|nr:DUF2490 domain-containing protein [Marinilongibacter aquaticus]UBM59801.1 DUF2490 domain-containing protein [Marinilongibacter aquaticus]
MRIICCTFLLLGLLVGHGAKAQRTVSHASQYWSQYYNQTVLNKDWSILVDGGFRWKEVFGQSSQYIARAALKRNLNARFHLAVGLANLGFYSSQNELNKLEMRPYFELGMKDKWGKVKLSHRYRIESRNFHTVNVEDMPVSKTHNLRYRYRLMCNIPLTKGKNPSLALLLGDEIFLNSGKSIVYNFFDQNRILVGPALQLNPSWGLNLMLSSTYAGTNQPQSYKFTQVFWLGIKHKIDLSKEKK